MNEFEIKKGYFKVHYRGTSDNLHVPERRDYSHLLDPEGLYVACKLLGKTPEKTIDIMLRNLHRGRYFDGDWLGNMSLCIAFVGKRGSGKSVGMTGMAIMDGLLAGRRVVSNLPIAVKVKYGDCEKVFQTEELDPAFLLDENEFNKNYYDCLIAIDEVNTYIADAQRTMNSQAFTFSNILQQMRHRKLSFIFTTQSEDFNTNRTRFQTDFYISCRDASMMDGQPEKKEIGRKTEWRYYDMTGLKTGDVLEADTRTNKVPPFQTRTFWNTPYWDCYSTELMQERKKYQKPKETREALEFDAARIEEMKVEFLAPVQIITNVIDMGMDRVVKADLWQMLNITGDHAMISRVGRIMKKLGCETADGTNGRAYELPPKKVMKKNMAKLGLEIQKEGAN